MPTIPHAPGFDSTLAVLREGYPVLFRRARRLQSDIFQTRLMGQKAICLHGPEAAQLFYDPARFVRMGAVPRRIQTTLMGQDGVQTLDGEAHRCRKNMFMAVMQPTSRHRLLELLGAEWQRSARRWARRPADEPVVLFEQAQDILCRAACAWVGVPLPAADVRHRAEDFGLMIDAFGGVGLRHGRGKAARRRAEKWIRGVVRAVRRGQLAVLDDAPAAVVCRFREPDGELLTTQMAAVEIINLLRPIVAIATYVTFAALALHEYPPFRGLLRRAPGGDYAELFAQEVRRYFPFTPFVGARVREDFTWHGYHFPKGTLTLLDVYGTLHDARVWQDPDVFWPDRFRTWQGSRYDFIPQGGGDYETGHRCAGEWITIEALKQAVQFLAAGMAYDVPPQDLRYDLARMPTLPRSGFVLTNVRLAAPAPAAAIPAVPEARAAAGGCPFH